MVDKNILVVYAFFNCRGSMPVDFLTAEHEAGYGPCTGEPNEVQLARYFHLEDGGLAIIFKRRGEQNQRGFALQLTSVRFLGALLDDVTLAPANVKVSVVRQVSAYDTSVLVYYAKKTRQSGNSEVPEPSVWDSWPCHRLRCFMEYPLSAALDHLQGQSFEISKDDKARLCPLPYGIFNVLGHY